MIEVGTVKQLFVDDELIDSMLHVFQVLNPGRKHPDNPLLVADQPWEAPGIYCYGTALHDPTAQGKERFRPYSSAFPLNCSTIPIPKNELYCPSE